MKKNIGKISLTVILINVIFLSIYLVNRNEETVTETEVQQVVYAEEQTQTPEETPEEAEPTTSYLIMDGAEEVENEDGLHIYRDADVTDEQVKMLITRLYRMAQIDKGQEFIEQVTWYITSNEAVTTSFTIDPASTTICVCNNAEYEITLEQLVLILENSALK